MSFIGSDISSILGEVFIIALDNRNICHHFLFDPNLQVRIDIRTCDMYQLISYLMIIGHIIILDKYYSLSRKIRSH